jgi:Flp pilus assembly protein TadG
LAKHFNNQFQVNLAGRKLLPRFKDCPMSPPAAATFSVRKALRRFGRNRRGSAAVEFALVAPVFFALLFAIIETAIIFFAGQVLETITQDSARQIMTGQAQNAAYTQAQFKTFLCGKIPALFTCSNVYVDVKSYPAFSNVTISDPIDSGKNFVPNMSYSPGVAGDIVVVRVFYQWPLFVTGLGYNISNLTGSKRLLSATAAFRNEPF